LFKPALYMTLQGAKWATFGEKRYKFAAGQALMVAVDIPSRGTVIVASSKKPYLGIAIELDFGIMREVAEDIEMALTVSGRPKVRGACRGDKGTAYLSPRIAAIGMLGACRAAQ